MQESRNSTPPPDEESARESLLKRNLRRFAVKPEIYCESVQGSGHALNEDCAGLLTAPLRLMVADGISQGNRSERAAQLSIKIFSRPERMSDKVLREKTLQLDQQVRELYREAGEAAGGTTLVVAEIRRGCIASLLNIGDSRAYLISKRTLFRGYSCRQVTDDQTYADYKKRVELENPDLYPDHVMIHAIGYGLIETEVNIIKVYVPPHAFLLLATDGAFKTLGDEPLAKLSEIASRSASSSDFGTAIIEHAVDQGEQDDISVAVFRPAFIVGARWPFWAIFMVIFGLLVLLAGYP